MTKHSAPTRDYLSMLNSLFSFTGLHLLQYNHLCVIIEMSLLGRKDKEYGSNYGRGKELSRNVLNGGRGCYTLTSVYGNGQQIAQQRSTRRGLQSWGPMASQCRRSERIYQETTAKTKIADSQSAQSFISVSGILITWRGNYLENTLSITLSVTSIRYKSAQIKMYRHTVAGSSMESYMFQQLILMLPHIVLVGICMVSIALTRKQVTR